MEGFSPSKKVTKISSTSSSVLPSPTNRSAMSPNDAKIDRDARVLNLSLETSLLFTLRAEAAVDGVIFMKQEPPIGDFINTTNLSMLMFSRLSENREMFGAVSYLCGCYKRLVAKEAATSVPKVKEDLTKYSRTKLRLTVIVYLFIFSCRGQVVSFLASCLGVPDMFESNSANSVGDLHVLLTEEATAPVMNSLLRDLADELDKQDYLHDVSRLST
jgi:hypothetical protein